MFVVSSRVCLHELLLECPEKKKNEKMREGKRQVSRGGDVLTRRERERDGTW